MADVTITAPNAINIVTSGGGGLELGSGEFNLITANTVSLLTGTTGDISINSGYDVSGASVNTIILDSTDNITITGALTAKAITAIADDDLIISENVTSSVGSISLESDDNGGGASLTFGAGKTIQSADNLTITTNGATASAIGSLNLRSVDNMDIVGALTANAGTLTLSADTGTAGSGTLTFDAINSAGQTVNLSGNDLDIGGAFTANLITFDATNSKNISLGDDNGGVVISTTDLGNITASTNFEVTTAGAVIIDNVTEASTDDITLMIVDSTGSITVQDDAAAQFSVFDAITLESDGTIAFNAGLTSDTGAISTTADFEDDNTGLITFATGVTLDSAGLLTLNARDQLRPSWDFNS